MKYEWDSKLTKCWTYETTSSLNDKHMKHQVDEMAGKWNSKMTKCQIDEFTRSQNDKQMKWQVCEMEVDKMPNWINV